LDAIEKRDKEGGNAQTEPGFHECLNLRHDPDSLDLKVIYFFDMNSWMFRSCHARSRMAAEDARTTNIGSQADSGDSMKNRAVSAMRGHNTRLSSRKEGMVAVIVLMIWNDMTRNTQPAIMAII